MSSIDHHIRELAPDGLQITIWPTKTGFQANVSERGLSGGWTCSTDPDPVEALRTALRLRATGSHGRSVVIEYPVEDQVDLETVIARSPVVDDFGDILG